VKGLCLSLLLASVASRVAGVLDPAQFSFEERPGTALPAQSEFRDSDNRLVRLTDLSHGVPLILVPAYLHCTNLCGIVRASLFGALRAANMRAGRDYVLAVLSIDPSETSAEARDAKESDISAFGLQGADRDLHYMTGDATSIKAVTAAVGFRNQFDSASRQFIHPAGVVFATASGVVSNYLLGVGFTPADIRSALQRAGTGRIAAVASPLLLICFHFDASTGRYTLQVMKLLRLAALFTVLTVAGVLFLLRRERLHR